VRLDLRSGILRGILRGHRDDILLRLEDGDHVGHRDLGAHLALGIPRKHDLHGDTDHTHTHEHVAAGGVNEVLLGLARRDEVTILELHGLGTLSPQLTADGDLTTLGTRLHDEAHDTVAGTAAGETTNELELDGLALRNCAQTTVVHALGVQLHGTVRELEALLNEGGQLANAATLLAEDIAGAGGADDNLGLEWGGADMSKMLLLPPK